jgi:hypothetical protein
MCHVLLKTRLSVHLRLSPPIHSLVGARSSHTGRADHTAALADVCTSEVLSCNSCWTVAPGSTMDSFPAGAAVRIVGLVKAAHHNGKTAVVSARSATSADRVGVTLDDGSTLSVRAANLQLVQPTHTAPQKDQAGAGPASASSGKTPKPAHAAASSQPGPVGQPKTLQMETQVLAEFDGSRDPDVMALYHHRRDMAFDAFNVSEYHAQLLDYYAKGVRVVEVVPRRIRDNLYFLVCLSHPDPTRNTLCQMAFQCRRQFLGYSTSKTASCVTALVRQSARASAHLSAPPSARRAALWTTPLSARRSALHRFWLIRRCCSCSENQVSRVHVAS